MIIVEGPDGSGKTTLIKRIEQELGITVEPRAVSKDAQALVPLDRWVELELAKGFGLRLYDRFALISAPRYLSLPDRTFRGDFTNVDWLSAVHYKMAKIDPLVILCLPSLDIVKANTKVDVHDGLNLEDQIETIYYSYLDWLASQVRNTSVMPWDYKNQDGGRLKNMLNWVKGRIEYEEHGEERRESKWKTS